MPNNPLRPPKNFILSILPLDESARLSQYLEPISLLNDQVLQEAGEPINYLYFPNNSVISLLALTEAGENIQVGMVGFEGVAGITGLPFCCVDNCPPYRMVVQVLGHAMRIRADILHDEFNRAGKLHSLMLCYLQVITAQMAQSCACNSFHKIKARLCRWLLEIQDLTKSHLFTITQETIAKALGVRRAGISEIISKLETAGLIIHRRRQITIIDKAGLESISCECYKIIKTKVDELLNYGCM